MGCLFAKHGVCHAGEKYWLRRRGVGGGRLWRRRGVEIVARVEFQRTTPRVLGRTRGQTHWVLGQCAAVSDTSVPYPPIKAMPHDTEKISSLVELPKSYASTLLGSTGKFGLSVREAVACDLTSAKQLGHDQSRKGTGVRACRLTGGAILRVLPSPPFP